MRPPTPQREWMDQQEQQDAEALASWPTNLFEYFFVVVGMGGGGAPTSLSISLSWWVGGGLRLGGGPTLFECLFVVVRVGDGGVRSPPMDLLVSISCCDGVTGELSPA